MTRDDLVIPLVAAAMLFAFSGGSLGRLEATARGALYCIREAVRKQDATIAGQRVVIEGFGNVGSFLAKFLAEEGATVIAVSDSSGGVYNSNGIDVDTAIAHKQETGALAGLNGRRGSRTRSFCCSTATSLRRARSSR